MAEMCALYHIALWATGVSFKLFHKCKDFREKEQTYPGRGIVHGSGVGYDHCRNTYGIGPALYE